MWAYYKRGFFVALTWFTAFLHNGSMKKRITVEVEDEEYTKLRSKLVLMGKTFTKWLNEVIKELNEKN